MKLSNRSIEALGKIITGDEQLSPYRSGPELVSLFNRYGADDRYGSGFPSRWQYAEDKLHAINGTDIIVELVKDVLRPVEFHDTDFEVDEAVNWLNGYLDFDGLRVVRRGNSVHLTASGGQRVSVASEIESEDPISHEFINSQIEKCNAKLASGDYDGAITNARSLVEGVLAELELRLTGETTHSKGDLNRQYKKVQKQLNLSPGADGLTTPLRQILSGLAGIVSGLAGVRNSLGDAHVRRYRVHEHHARLAVNAASTLADFLLETFDHQQADGTAN